MLQNHPAFSWLCGYEAKRKQQLKRTPEGALKDFLSVPFPALNTPYSDLEILSVDFETTGLHAINDKLLSVGFVTLKHNQMALGSSYHQVIKTVGDLSADNVLIHQITDDVKNRGEQLRIVVEKLLNALAGKVMLVHFARIEKQFLTQACIELYGVAPVWPIIDTLMVEKRRMDTHDVAYDPSELRLSPLRNKYSLPEHFGHNALNDAIATAELLMVQVNNMPKPNDVVLSDLLL
jgi:DNA polymerase-3 subunit epsilon